MTPRVDIPIGKAWTARVLVDHPLVIQSDAIPVWVIDNAHLLKQTNASEVTKNNRQKIPIVARKEINPNRVILVLLRFNAS